MKANRSLAPWYATSLTGNFRLHCEIHAKPKNKKNIYFKVEKGIESIIISSYVSNENLYGIEIGSSIIFKICHF